MTDRNVPATDGLRARVEETRDELGRTVEALAGKADVKGRAQERTAEVKDRAQEAAGQARARMATAAHTLGEKVRDRTPEPARDGTGRALEAVRNRPGVLLAAGVAACAAVLVVRRRGRR